MIEYLDCYLDVNLSGESMVMKSHKKISWYPLVSKKIRKKIQITQNECIRFCLKPNSRHHIGANEFKEINWLLTKEKVEQRIATNDFKY